MKSSPTFNFKKHFSTYNHYAYVQKKVAQELIEWIPKINIQTALEIGCGTGIFTEQIINYFHPKTLIINDYYDTRPFLSVPYSDFLLGNVEKIELPKTEIILSSSVFQWINTNNLNALFEKLSKKCSSLAFSMYVEGNLKEIKEHFDYSLNYQAPVNIKRILEKYFPSVKMKNSTYVYHFQQPIEALKHLKYTGVTNTLNKTSLSKLRHFPSKTLTYEVGYFYTFNEIQK